MTDDDRFREESRAYSAALTPMRRRKAFASARAGFEKKHGRPLQATPEDHQQLCRDAGRPVPPLSLLRALEPIAAEVAAHFAFKN